MPNCSCASKFHVNYMKRKEILCSSNLVIINFSLKGFIFSKNWKNKTSSLRNNVILFLDARSLFQCFKFPPPGVSHFNQNCQFAMHKIKYNMKYREMKSVGYLRLPQATYITNVEFRMEMEVGRIQFNVERDCRESTRVSKRTEELK